MSRDSIITSPDHPALDQLCEKLSARAASLEAADAWPGEQLDLCAEYGVFQWFLPTEWTGLGWSDADVYRGYLRLSAACLTTTFVITQRSGACRRIAASGSESLKSRLLPDLASGRSFATLGISHLTTSRRHLDRPILRVEEADDGFILDGFSPWVTGAAQSDTVVTGGTMDDGRQVMIALPMDLPGISTPSAARLVGLSASQTGEVRLNRVHVPNEWLLQGPAENIMQQGGGGATGGLQTSTLAIGLSGAAIDYIENEGERRPDLLEPADRLREDLNAARVDLLSLAEGDAACSTEDLRVRANSLALRSTQAALAAAKGTGYVEGHPTGRWCREALFFLVWSCPQPVMAANLCELAGIE